MLTPAIAALRPKRRTGLVSLPAVRAEVARMLEALAMGGFPVSCTWTLNGDPAAWQAVAGTPPDCSPTPIDATARRRRSS